MFIAKQVISSLNFSAPQLSSLAIESTIIFGVMLSSSFTILWTPSAPSSSAFGSASRVVDQPAVACGPQGS